MNDTYMTVHGHRMRNVHSDRDCEGRRCIVHRQTWHHMAGWPMNYRDDLPFPVFERVCVHHIGHPDPDQFDYWKQTNHMAWAVHGCDGCCSGNEAYEPA